MKRFFGKKQVMLATLAVALGLAVYLNYYFAQQDRIGTAEDASSAVTTTAASGAGQTGSTGHLGDSQYVSAGSPTEDAAAQETVPTAAAAELPYFKEARANREAARAESLEILQELVNDVKSSQSVIAQATEKIAAAAQAVEQESKIENLIKAKGFADCVVYIEEENCNAVVQADGLTAAETLQITEIITAQSAVRGENIKITAVNS